MAGDKVFDSLEEKRDFIHQRIQYKYAKVLRIPEWSDEEMDSMGGKLKKNIQLSMRLRRLTEARMRWPFNWFSEMNILNGTFEDLFE